MPETVQREEKLSKLPFIQQEIIHSLLYKNGNFDSKFQTQKKSILAEEATNFFNTAPIASEREKFYRNFLRSLPPPSAAEISARISQYLPSLQLPATHHLMISIAKKYIPQGEAGLQAVRDALQHSPISLRDVDNDFLRDNSYHFSSEEVAIAKSAIGYTLYGDYFQAIEILENTLQPQDEKKLLIRTQLNKTYHSILGRAPLQTELDADMQNLLTQATTVRTIRKHLKELKKQQVSQSRRNFLVRAGGLAVGAGAALAFPSILSSESLPQQKPQSQKVEVTPTVNATETPNNLEGTKKQENISHAQEILSAIQENLIIKSGSGQGLPGEEYNISTHQLEGTGCGLWQFTNILAAANILSRIPNIGPEYQKQAEDMYLLILQRYKQNNPDMQTTLLSTAPINKPQSASIGVDDYAEFALEVLRIYEVSQDEERKSSILSLIQANWEEVMKQWEINNPYRTGGLPWHYGPGTPQDEKARTMAANGTWAKIGARLYELTQDQKYLGGDGKVTGAIDIYNWINTNLQDTETLTDLSGVLYFDTVDTNGVIEKAHYPYNEGNVIRTAIALFRATRDKKYLHDARATVLGALEFYNQPENDILKMPQNNKPGNHGPKLVVDFFESLYSWLPYENDPAVKQQMIDIMDNYRSRVWENKDGCTRFPNSLFQFPKDSHNQIITIQNGAIAKIFAMGGLQEQEYSKLY